MTDLSGPLFQTGPSAGYQPGGDAGIKRVGDGSKPKAEKRTTRKDVEALFAILDPAPAASITKAQKERERLTNSLDATVRGIRADLTKLRILDTADLAKAEATAKALLALHKNATAAISAIPDAKLDPPAEKPKAAKPVTKIEEPAPVIEQVGEDPRENDPVQRTAVDEDSAF